MAIDNNNLSVKEIDDLIFSLKERQNELRLRGIQQIKQLAESINIHVEIFVPGDIERFSNKVRPSIKYRDPNNHKNTWTGKGRIPRWLSAYINQGQSIDIFKT
ncbi:H-NS histone family protein [Methylomicrobium sp. RS1]|jgi:DNA-binding protein H-NS|uniref:H-NS histone family protein n=1 Tax=Candidatus Methylomicrobium oryzae TaxID=2802053 RepID=UPI001921A7F0|nr:H-NS histone family protein [Methylomicrobium sp. RS1]MBL1265492.1 H-NS histone family protein [Methylomicrobium sp. RS1]